MSPSGMEHRLRLGASPLVARAERRERWRQRLKRAVDALDVADEALAGCIGVSRARLRHWLSPEREDAIPVADVEALPIEARRALAEALAESCGCTLAELPSSSVEPLSDVRLLADTVRGTSAAVAGYADAIADGTIDADESTRIERLATEAIRALATMRLRARQGVRERAVSVRVLDGGRR